MIVECNGQDLNLYSDEVHIENIDLELVWKNNNFHSVVDLSKNYRVLDLTKNSWPSIDDEYCVGRYDEVRPNMHKFNFWRYP